MAEVADGAIKASWPGLSRHPRRPSASTQASAKSLATVRLLPAAPRRDSFLRRPGVDGRDKPGHDGKGSTNEQQTGRPTDNAIRAKSRRLAVGLTDRAPGPGP